MQSRPQIKKRRHIVDAPEEELKNMNREELLALETFTTEESNQRLLLIHYCDQKDYNAYLEHGRLNVATGADLHQKADKMMRQLCLHDDRKRLKKRLQEAVDAVVPFEKLLADSEKYEGYKKLVIGDIKENHERDVSIDPQSFEEFLQQNQEVAKCSILLNIKIFAIREECLMVDNLFKVSEEKVFEEILSEKYDLISLELMEREGEKHLEGIKITKANSKSFSAPTKILAVVGGGISFGAICTGIYIGVSDNIYPAIATIIAGVSAVCGGLAGGIAIDGANKVDISESTLNKISSKLTTEKYLDL